MLNIRLFTVKWRPSSRGFKNIGISVDVHTITASRIVILRRLVTLWGLLASLIRAAILHLSFRLHLFTFRCFVIGSPD